MRLGIFLVVSTAILIFSLIYLVGSSLLDVRDNYQLILQGGSGGLEVGSQVRFNDITVGRVEGVKLNKDDPTQVFIYISLEHGTPVTVDTVATPEMANITGTKMLSMKGGTKDSKRLKPGDTIKSAESDFSQLSAKILDISNKIEVLVENLVLITNSENSERITQVLVEVEGITKNINTIIADNRGNISTMLVDAQSVITKADIAMDGVNATIARLSSTQNLKQIEQMIARANKIVGNVEARTSDKELGQTIASVNVLTHDTHVTILRLRDDMRRLFTELETSVEGINEFVQILVDNPSVLISGRSEKERQLP